MSDTDAARPLDDGPVEELAPVRPNAPSVPWKIVMQQFIRTFTPLPNGGMVLHVTVAVMSPAGVMPIGPAVDVVFGNAEQWESFQRDAANGGQVSSLAVASELPPGLRGMG